MAKTTINLKGTSNSTYNLDTIKNDSRLNGDLPLIVQVHKYTKGNNPNPSNLQLGQVWLSKLVENNEA